MMFVIRFQVGAATRYLAPYCRATDDPRQALRVRPERVDYHLHRWARRSRTPLHELRVVPA